MAFPLGLVIQLALQILQALKDAGIFDHKSAPADHPITLSAIELAKKAAAGGEVTSQHIADFVKTLPGPDPALTQG